MAEEKFMYLWRPGRPEEALKLHILGDPRVTGSLESWASEEPTFMATMSEASLDDANQLPLFAHVTMYMPGDREHPGGN